MVRNSKCWWNYAVFIADALKSLGIKLIPLNTNGCFYIKWNFHDRSVITAIHWSDEPQLFDLRQDMAFDGMFKQRLHPKRYRSRPPKSPPHPPVFAGGFGPARVFDQERVDEWRRVKDGDQIDKLLHTRMTYRWLPSVVPSYINRRKFCQVLRPTINSYHPTQWCEAIATHRWALNLCGNGNSIDVKVAQFLAAGTAIISDRGLEDLELPWGKRFIHGENIWFVDQPRDVKLAMEHLTGDRWRRLVDGSRELYDQCFHPEALGRWYLRCASQLKGTKHESR
jgi:hypothetical protein